MNMKFVVTGRTDICWQWRTGKLGCELQLGETVRDIRLLHSEQFFAVSQKKYVYLYDRQGVELHVLKKHREVSHMEYIPYHYLLATLVGEIKLYAFWRERLVSY